MYVYFYFIKDEVKAEDADDVSPHFAHRTNCICGQIPEGLHTFYKDYIFKLQKKLLSLKQEKTLDIDKINSCQDVIYSAERKDGAVSYIISFIELFSCWLS